MGTRKKVVYSEERFRESVPCLESRTTMNHGTLELNKNKYQKHLKDNVFNVQHCNIHYLYL